MAAERDETRQVVVQFGDLNLSNPQGAAALYRRIASAANEVCDAYGIDSRVLGSRTSIDACVKKAISDAVTKVGRSELFAVYNAKNSGAAGNPGGRGPEALIDPSGGGNRHRPSLNAPLAPMAPSPPRRGDGTNPAGRSEDSGVSKLGSEAG